MADCCITPDLTLCTAGPCCSTAPSPSPELQAIASELALGFLWAATGRRFARTCNPITVRPCKPDTCKPNSVQDIIYWEARRAGDGTQTMGVMSFTPTLIDGSAYNIACGCPQGCCTCRADCEVYLPGPVCEIVDVVVGGVHVGQNAYSMQVDNVGREKLVFRNVGAQIDNPMTLPLPTGITQVDAGPLGLSGCGLQLSTIGHPYEFSFSSKQDLQFVIEIPAGNGPTEFHVFQPQGFDVIVLQGRPSSLVVSGSDVQVGFATLPETIKLLVRAPHDWNSTDLTIRQDTGANPINLCTIQWSDFTTGTGYCPPCQDYNLPLDEPGTWSVTYTLGEKWPAGAAQIAGLIACQFGQELAGQSSGLPADVAGLVRQGITIELPNPFDQIQAMMTGIRIVDRFIRAWNPYGVPNRSRVWSPDLPTTRREF